MVKYLADDGTEFSSENDALAYEQQLTSPARKITFSGHSDDIVEIINYDKNNGDIEEFYGREFELRGLDGSMLIVPVYNGCWSFAVSLVDEDFALPDWKCSFEAKGYVCLLHVEVPVGTVLIAKK